MKITKIELQNFRAFYGNYQIDLGKGKNLLVYGENGSGKSSLYHALHEFLTGQGRSLKPMRNIFADPSAEAFIKLSVAAKPNTPPEVLTWSDPGNSGGAAVNDTDRQYIRDAANTSGFLEYKGLLETYFLQIQNDRVNIFNLIYRLLHDSKDARTGRTLEQDWQHIEAMFRTKHGSIVKRDFNQLLRSFNQRIARLLKDLQFRTEEILERFGYRVKLQFTFEGVRIDYMPSKHMSGDSIHLDVAYFDRPIERHHTFLNEAKLSALALAIYFAALLQTPHDQSKLNLLVLDDVLIGLDMSNRLPMLDILHQFFKDYQIVFLTYDRTWYEMVKTRLSGSEWKTIELYCGSDPALDLELPIYADSAGYVQRAKDYFAVHDYRGAIMYSRTAFEAMMKDFCAKRQLNVRYRWDNRHEANDLWSAVKGAKKDGGGKFIETALEKEIEFNMRYFLNTLSHANIVNVVRKEVEEVIQTIETLEELLSAAPKK